VKALLKQFKDNPNTPLIRHFDLTYIQKGLSRLSNHELADLLPLLTENVARDAAASAVNGSKLFNCLLRSLSVYKLPLKGTPDDTALRTTLAISDADAKFLSFWFGKVILLRSGSASGSTPGVSEDEQSFLTLQGRPETWDHLKSDGLNLAETRSRVLTFLASGAFTSDERFLPALFSSADAASRIADLGEDMLKRALPNIDLTDRDLISKLYDIYFSYYTSNDQNASHYVPAVRVPVRTKIISVLSKSQTSTTFPEKVHRLAQKDLVEGDSTLSKNDREVLKLRSAVVGFVSFMSRQAAKSDLAAIAQPLIRLLQTFIEQQGEDNRTPDFKTLRGSTYEIIGQLAAANRTVLLQSDLALLRWLFQSLAEESDRDVVVSVDEALSSTMRSFQQGLDDAVEVALRGLLTDVMTQESRNARNLQYAALRFANRCLAYSDVTSRYIDLLALATPESSHDMVEEAKKGLDPYWYRLYQTNETLGRGPTLDARSAFPDFTELASYVFTPARASQLPANVLAIAVQYARQSLIWAALATTEHSIEVDTEWERKLDLAALQDQSARSKIRQYLQNLVRNETEREALALLWQVAVKGMLSEQQVTDRAQCARVVVELCVFSPSQIQQDMASYAVDLEPAVLANDIELRTLSAQAYGLLSAEQHEPSAALVASFEGLMKRIVGWETAVGADANRVHGAALALSSYICHRLYTRRDDATATRLLTELLPLLLTILDKATDAFLSQASFASLGMLCQYFVINVKRIETHLDFSSVLDKILKWAKAGNEKAINALGYLAMTMHEEDEAENLKQLTDKIRELHEIRQMETQFAVGEALAAAGCGWESSALLPQLDMDGPPPSGPKRTSFLAPLIDKTLVDSTNTKPSLKKASVVWLLCFIQFCSDRPEVQERLRKFQVAFKRCLSDRDDLVQEASSRGLGLVYEKGGKEIQDELVRDLVGSFSGDRTALAGTVSEDTQLFDAGALPTGEGQSVTTYKVRLSTLSRYRVLTSSGYHESCFGSRRLKFGLPLYVTCLEQCHLE
jgi:proteasome component ECM29